MLRGLSMKTEMSFSESLTNPVILSTKIESTSKELPIMDRNS
jgi:hypothetical protein